MFYLLKWKFSNIKLLFDKHVSKFQGTFITTYITSCQWIQIPKLLFFLFLVMALMDWLIIHHNSLFPKPITLPHIQSYLKIFFAEIGQLLKVHLLSPSHPCIHKAFETIS
jgi:hypothetical protein